ncbi:MAG: hypothetical protein ONB46_04100 [candidate division KSB1 bacterium]|nr:hypothetical protein [candidate division KSB1 bacterium]MDZ7365198.1 hypothetical protein [candidate division KSB1 bacterium]MDZ7406960.1 hypothetical protein [candidate division KSB1 bacterium]
MSTLSWTHARVSVAGHTPMGFRQFISSVIGCILLLGVTWPHAKALGQTQTGAAIAKITRSGFAKSNQNKVFYHDGKWWAIAYNTSADKWYVWQFSNGAWDKTVALNKSKSYKYDAVVNSAAGKLYVMGSHTSSSEFWRFSYSTSTATWTKDAGFKVNPDFPNGDGSNPVSLIQASNGDLWIFRVAGNKLQAKRSTNGGASWSAVIDVKTGLTTASGTTDGVAFTAGGGAAGAIGVAYGESAAAGSQYGFLIHRDGDPENVWADESTALTFFGSERADNKIAVTTDQYNNVYLFTQNANVSGGAPNNTLYKRSSSGVWTKFAVNDNTSGLIWKTPAIVADISNDVLYVMGVNTSTQFAEYKSCAIGAEASLSTAAAATILAATGASFDDLSVPTPFVDAASGLMICGDNLAASDIWYNQIALGSTSSGQPPITVNGLSVAPNEANTAGSYTIPFTLGNQGALTAGSETITIQFPANTSVPSSIAANQMTVNGTAVTTVVSNSNTREVIITTPINLPNNANVTLEFGAGANLLNPPNAGNYSLQAWTSVQTSPANSPSYVITAATTMVSAATVTPNPTATNAASAYTIAFNLGSHGRLVSGSTITLTFNNATTVTNGNLSGVQVNGVSATATGNSSNKTVVLEVPASLSLSNGAAVTLSLPSSAITNPSSPSNYTLTVATSVETTPVTSNAYAITSSPPPPPVTGEDEPISGTTGGYDKPHQNRPFYHDGRWWTAARKSSDGKWYLWKLNGASWSADLEIDSRSSTRPDCHVDSPANKLYILLASSSSTGTKILRLSYSGSAWSIDAGFPVVLSSFTFSGESGNVFVKAKNGELWAFRYFSGKVEGKRSSDDGLTWSSTFTVTSSLVSTGLCDAVAFSSGGENYVGVGYAENTATSGKFGFLLHKDGDADGDWTNETGLMPQFSSALSDDHLSMAVSPNNEIFFVCKTHPNSSSAAGIGLLKRSAGGNWQNFTVQQGGGWTRPAIVIDETNKELYVFGTQEASPKYGQYKKCAIGNENSLKNATPVNIFDDSGFNNLSVPQHRVTGATEMLVCVEKSSGSEIWYNLLPISGSGSSTKSAANFVSDNGAEVVDDGELPRILAYPNPFNPATTIRFKLTAPAPVTLQIFNLRGALVRTLLDRDLDSGTHEQFWNGRDNFGRQVASGTYFYRLRLGAAVWRGRLEMVK